MKKSIFAIVALLASVTFAFAQSSPGLTNGQVLTAAQWNALFASKQDVLGYVPLNTSGGTLTGRLITSAPAGSLSGFNLAPGSTPSSPADGDLWMDPTGFYARVNGATVGPISSGLTAIGANTVLGSIAGGLPTALNKTQVTTLINSCTASLSGAVPAVGSATGKFLRDDCSWQVAGAPTVGANQVLGSIAGGTAVGLTTTQVTTLVNTFTTSLSGAVPAPGTVSSKFLRDDGTWQTVGSGATITLGTSVMSGYTNGYVVSNNGGFAGQYAISGSGNVAMTTSPVFTTPNLGTPSAATLTNATGLPISTGLTGAGTGVISALGNAVGASGGFTLFSGAFGTPTSITLTNATGLPLSTGVIGTLGVANGGTGGSAASGTLLDNITGFSSTGYMRRTGAGVYAFSAAATSSQYFAGAATGVPIEPSVIYQAETTTAYATTVTFDFSTFINTSVTLTGNITTQTLSNVKAGQAGTIAFIQDGTGSRTTVWNSIFKWAGGSAPVLSTAAGAIDVLMYSCRSATFCVASLAKSVQ